MTAWDDYLRTQLPGLVLRSHDNYYPSVSAAIQALDWLAAHSHVVVGFEGLDTDGRNILPSLEWITDFSSISELESRQERVDQSISASRRLLQAWLGQVQFVDLIVEEPESTETPD
jgi:hypothetical protein